MNATGWRLEREGGLLLARSAAFDAIPRIAHAVSTRVGPEGGFDLCSADDTEPRVLTRRAALARAAGCLGSTPAILRQVHGARIVSASETRGALVEADGVVGSSMEDESVPIPAVRAADCVPVLLASRSGAVFAAVHAGWRGIAAGIAGASVRALAVAGARPDEIVAGLGPAIGPCCYEVGPEVVEGIARTGVARDRFVRAGERGGVRVDLHGALAAQLEGAGLPAGAVDPAPWCTRCRGDLFFSYRRDGGSAGRLMGLIGRSARQS